MCTLCIGTRSRQKVEELENNKVLKPVLGLLRVSLNPSISKTWST